METSTLQFDSDLGGTETLPCAYNTSDFLKDRLEEILMLTEAIKESPFRGQAFQRLPKHMRRRQMSHYIKRLPRRLQRPYLLTLKEGIPAPSKCPSRKHRRRPNNLLLEYNRRQKKNVWLETHIWHAKRFKMTKKWGYNLPESPINKSFRACYRAISKHCLVTDISYYNCIELEGPEDRILKGLKCCTSEECGLTFAAKTYLQGTKEGSVTVFHPNTYPYQVIGNVNFMWKTSSAKDSKRKIWIWIHPLIHDEIVQCFKTLFDLTPKNCDLLHMSNELINDDSMETNSESQIRTQIKKKKDQSMKKKIEIIKMETKKIPFCRVPQFVNGDESVHMSLLKDTLNRFQLSGPLSTAIISQIFQPIKSPPLEDSNPSKDENYCDETTKIEVGKKRIFDEDSDLKIKKIKMIKSNSSEGLNVAIEEKQTWWKEYYGEEVFAENCRHQQEFYKKLKNCIHPMDVPSRLVFSLVIEDPRLIIPAKRKKAVPQISVTHQMPENLRSVSLAESPIWREDIRDVVSLTKLSTHEINKARAENIVPGCDIENVLVEEKKSKIPILLIQRPGVVNQKTGRLGFGCGWDIISPAGYGMPIWQALIFRGARCGGLREADLLRLETNNLKDCLQPDSPAGKAEDEAKRSASESHYFRLPPNKRPNFVKLGIPSPFHCPWDILTEEWIKSVYPGEPPLVKNSQNQSFRVLRCQKHLQNLKEALMSYSRKETSDFDELVKRVGVDCLVAVSVECSRRGKPKDLALICLPIEEDLDSSDSGTCPVESSHPDENQSLRKTLKSDHSKLLKSLRRKRRKVRTKLRESHASGESGNKVKWKDISKVNAAPSEKHRAEYENEMRRLWVPPIAPPTDRRLGQFMINLPQRKIMGFVVKGDFVYSKSISFGLGYVSIVALIEWLKMLKCSPTKRDAKVLIRNRDQVQYRFGKLKIL